MSRLRRWLRRGLWAVLGLFLLMIVAHRPLLRLAVDWTGRHYAVKNGYTLEWKVSGSFISDVSLGEVRLAGPANGVIRHFECRHALLDFNLWTVLTKGVAKGLRGFTLADARMEVDARPRDLQASRPAAVLPDAWLRRLDLLNINARVVTGDGDIVLRGLTLLLDETKTGTLEIAELSVPATGLLLTDVHAITEQKARTVILTDLALATDIAVPRLVMDMQYLPKGSLPFELSAHSGKATIKSSGRVDNITGNVSLDLTLALSHFAHTDVARWMKLPKDASWLVESAEVRVKGPLAEPQKLNATLSLAASNVLAPNVRIDSLSTRASMTDGALKIESLTARDGPNYIEATATAMLPPRWNDIAQISADVLWRLRVPRLENIAALGADFTGELHGEGLLSIAHGEIDRAQASLHGNNLAWRQRRIEKAALDFQIHDGLAVISDLDVRLDAENSMSATGDVKLASPQPVNLHWQTDIKNLAAVADWLDVQDWPMPSAGRFASQGTASLALAEVRERNLHNLQADATASMTDVVWKKGRLDHAALDFSIHDSRLEVRKFEARLNDRNTLKVKGHLMLDEPGEFDAEISGALDQLSDFSGWMELAGQPRITGGRASLSWKGGGKIAQREVTGAGALNITDLKLEGRPDVLALTLETSHAGRRAEITKLVASAGKLRAEAGMTITDSDLVISKLVLFSGKTRLIDGSAEVPLALARTPRPALPLDGTRPMKVRLHLEQMDVRELFAALGQPPPLMGHAAVDLELNGTLAELSGKFSATLSDARLEATKGRLEPTLVQLDATLAGRVLAIKATAREKSLPTLTAEAELPFDVEKLVDAPSSLLDAPLKARITLPGTNLSVLRRFVPVIVSINGTGSADVRLGGTMRKPALEGEIRADAARLLLKESDMDIRDVKMRATFNGQRLVLDDVTASLSGGALRVGGTVDLAPLTDPVLNLRLEMQQALIVRNDAMSMRADGAISLTGTAAKADVAGRLELVRGRVFKEIEFLPLSLPDQLPPPPPMVRAMTTPSLPPPLALWNLNVDIVTRDPIRLLGNVLNGGAAADFHLSGTGAVPVLEGKLSQQGAHIQLPFSRLKLSRGDVIFTKENPFEPQLDLQGESVVGNYQVTVYATCAAAKPTLRFTSSPPLSEPEIASLLATGTTVGDAQSAGGVAANRVAFLVLSKAYRRLFNKAVPTRRNEEPGRASFSLNPLGSGSSLGSVSGTFEITPNWQAEIGLGERGFRGMISYLVRFR